MNMANEAVADAIAPANAEAGGVRLAGDIMNVKNESVNKYT